MAEKEVMSYNAQFSEYFFSLETSDKLIIVLVENTMKLKV
jgi:hypothetical protein